MLDHANTIEFNYVNLEPASAEVEASRNPLHMADNFLRSEYPVLEKDYAANQNYVKDICRKLQKINEILFMGNAHVAYSVRDEI